MTALEESSDAESVDRLLSVLSNESNRHVVRYFRDSGEEVASLDELAGYASETMDRPPEDVALRLHHGGLPKLTEAGLVEYDPRSQRAWRDDHPMFEVDELGELLELE
jgi:hypothetical protein